MNKLVASDVYPMPLMADLLNVFQGMKMFSSVDLMAGFNQIPIEHESKKYWSIITTKGVYLWETLPFGPKNGPATCQRMLNGLISGLHHSVGFVDDIITASQNFDDHIADLERLFTRIEDSGLKLSYEKSKLFRKEVNFMGLKVTEAGIMQPMKRYSNFAIGHGRKLRQNLRVT